MNASSRIPLIVLFGGESAEHDVSCVTAAHVINPLLLPKHPYDAIKDFSPIATLVSTDYILVLNAALPANTLSEFIALAKAKPGQLNGAGSNTGGIQPLALELFNMLANVKLQHVPYSYLALACF